MKNLFNYPRNLTYLNTGSMSLIPKSVAESISQWSSNIENNPTAGLITAWGRLWNVQKSLASHFGANPKNLFLRQNVTFCLNDFIMALTLPKNSEILVSDLEYGAIVNICRYKCEMENLQLRFFSPRPETVLEDMCTALSSKTRAILVSHITSSSGFVFPIEEMAKICREKNILFIVDGAHGAGALPLDFSKTEIDFYGGNLHKWLLGPKGTGFGWVSPQVCPLLQPQFAGWTSYDTPPHFKEFAEGDAWATRWMICSTVNFADYLAIPTVIEFWDKYGEQIYKTQSTLKTEAFNYLISKLKWESPNSKYTEIQSGPMFSFQLPEKYQLNSFKFGMKILEEDKIQISITNIRGKNHLRVSPHVYNDMSEIEKLAQCLLKK